MCVPALTQLARPAQPGMRTCTWLVRAAGHGRYAALLPHNALLGPEGCSVVNAASQQPIGCHALLVNELADKLAKKLSLLGVLLA